MKGNKHEKIRWLLAIDAGPGITYWDQRNEKNGPDIQYRVNSQLLRQLHKRWSLIEGHPTKPELYTYFSRLSFHHQAYQHVIAIFQLLTEKSQVCEKSCQQNKPSHDLVKH